MVSAFAIIVSTTLFTLWVYVAEYDPPVMVTVDESHESSAAALIVVQFCAEGTDGPPSFFQAR